MGLMRMKDRSWYCHPSNAIDGDGLFEGVSQTKWCSGCWFRIVADPRLLTFAAGVADRQPQNAKVIGTPISPRSSPLARSSHPHIPILLSPTHLGSQCPTTIHPPEPPLDVRYHATSQQRHSRPGRTQPPRIRRESFRFSYTPYSINILRSPFRCRWLALSFFRCCLPFPRSLIA